MVVGRGVGDGADLAGLADVEGGVRGREDSVGCADDWCRGGWLVRGGGAKVMGWEGEVRRGGRGKTSTWADGLVCGGHCVCELECFFVMEFDILVWDLFIGILYSL